MATVTSYGSITIVDITDIGEFSVYPKANGSRTQIYNPDANSYIPNWDTSVNGGVAMVISPIAYYAGTNVTSSATYTWKRKVGTTESNISSTNGETVNNGILTINKNVLNVTSGVTSGLITYVVYASYTIDGHTLQAIGEIDFSLVKQGSRAKIAKIIGENVFKYDTSGILIPANHTITLTTQVDNVSITGWKYYNPSNANADAQGYVTYPNSSNTATLTVDPSDNVFINDIVKIKLVTNDNDVYDIFTITKLKDGAAGQSVVSAVLSNEDQMIPFDKYGNVVSGAYDSAVSTLTIYKGSNNVTNQWTITKTCVGVTEDVTTTSIPNQVKIASINASTGKVVFNCSKNEYETGENAFTKEFSLVKIEAGADGTSPTIYSLEASTVAVNKSYGENDSVSFTPSSVVFNAYYQTGNGAKTDYPGRIQFYVNGSSSITDAYNTNTNTRTFNFSNYPGTNRLQAVLYEAGANSNRLDAQTVIVTSDGLKGDPGQKGDQGVSAVSLIINNQADVIPCTSDNHPIPNGTGADSDKFIITIPFEGYQGLVKKTTSATTAPVLSKTIWGTTNDISPVLVTANETTTGSIVYKIPSTATVPQSGQINFTFTVQADGGNVLISKVYSWARSSAATNGTNAVVLLLLTQDGTVFENGSGILYAQGKLYDGASEATGETYTWYQYKSGEYKLVNSSNTPGVTTGHLAGTTWTAGGNGSTNTTSDMIKITPSAVDGYASFKVVSSYNGNSYEQYVSIIDKSDPVQVSVHSTLGTQLVNGQGAGALYARVSRNGIQLDPIGDTEVIVGTTAASGGNSGDHYIKLDGSNKTATLYVKNGSNWVVQTTSGITYEWTFRDSQNIPITGSDLSTKFGSAYSSQTGKVTGKCLYLDKNTVDNKITADVKVTVS